MISTLPSGFVGVAFGAAAYLAAFQTPPWKVGKDATLFAMKGDILHLRPNVKRMRVAGKEVSFDAGQRIGTLR